MAFLNIALAVPVIKPTRPLMRYHGSKWKLAPWVLSFFPEHKVYVEPFGGGASVLLLKERSTTEIYNDLDRDVVSLFRVAREFPDQLARALTLTPYARDEYNLLYEPSSDPVEAARRFISRSFMGINSKGAFKKSGFDVRVNADGFVSRIRSLTGVPDQIAIIAGRFTNVVIENVPALDLINRYNRDDVLFYLDPPYVSESRSGNYYRHEMSNDDHALLADTLHKSSAMVVISGYASKLYDLALYPDWKRFERRHYTDGGRSRSEVVWLNYAAASKFHRRNGELF